MQTITIPKKIAKSDDLIIIPRKEYEEFSDWKKNIKFFQPTISEQKAIKRGKRETKNREYIDVKNLRHELER